MRSSAAEAAASSEWRSLVPYVAQLVAQYESDKTDTAISEAQALLLLEEEELLSRPDVYNLVTTELRGMKVRVSLCRCTTVR
jgi:hypothetical protein